jgi:hypothetical protein
MNLRFLHLLMTQAKEFRQLTGGEVAAALAGGMRWSRDFSGILRFLVVESALPGARLATRQMMWQTTWHHRMYTIILLDNATSC